MNDRQYTIRNDSLTMVPWNELTPDRQREIFDYSQSQLAREREEVRFLRMLLLSNGGRTAEEIDKIMWSVK